MQQIPPPAVEPTSPTAKILVVVGLLALMGAGGAIVWKMQNPPEPFDFQPIYDAPPPNAKKVLWVGNSHMWWWEMPRELQMAVPEGQQPMWYELIAQPGVTLSDHLRSGPAVARARSGEFDVIMLQPQSVEPVSQPVSFVDAVAAWERIGKEAGAEVVVWSPWGRDPDNDGYNVYTADWSGGSLAELTNRMEEAANNATQSGSVCPLGAAWVRAHNKHPKAPLWSNAKGNHASQIGTYLTNAMLYACLWRRDPREISYVPDLVSAENAEKLRIVAWETAVSKGIIEGDFPGDDVGEEEGADEEVAEENAEQGEPDEPVEDSDG